MADATILPTPETWVLHGGIAATLRPIRPGDAAMEQQFIRGLSREAGYFRFMMEVRELTPEMLQRFTNIDPGREMAFVVTVPGNPTETEIAVGRYAINPDGTSCEFALVVTDDWQHHGIGGRLMQALIEHAQARGLKRMEGFVMAANSKMSELLHTLGFSGRADPDDATVRIFARDLQEV